MAITVAQTIAFDNAQGSSTSYTKSSISTTAGRLLILAVLDDSASSSKVNSVTDSAGNTWTERVRANNNTGTVGASIWSTTNNASAVTSITVTLSAGGGMIAQIYEVTGADVVDVTASNTGASTAVSSGSSGTPAGSADLAIGVGGFFSGFATYAFSSRAFTTAGGTFVTKSAGILQEQGVTGSVILSSALAQTFSFTSDNSDDWAAAIALWKPAPPDGAGTLTTPTTALSGLGNTVTFTYTAGSEGVSSGSITIVVPAEYSAPSLTTTAPGYTTASTGSVGVSGQTITVSSVTLAASATMTTTYGSKASSGPGATGAGSPGPQTWQVQAKGSSGGTLTNIASSPSIKLTTVATTNQTYVKVGDGMSTGERWR